MAFEPPFMHDLSSFRDERDRCRDLEQWDAFYDKWLDAAAWPMKTGDEPPPAGGPGPLRLGGRLWSRTSFAYDLTPEARYELFYALKVVGDPIRFPLEVRRPKTEAIWSQQCPFCELSTRDHGPDKCPQCARKLLWTWSAG